MRLITAPALSLAVLLALGACGDDVVAQGKPPGSQGWQSIPDAPLSPRVNAVAAWTGTEALFLGGETGGFCPPNAGCVGGADRARDGAAYTPSTGVWRRTANAPVALSGPMAPAVIGDEVFLIQDRRLLAYDAGRDRWTRHGTVSKAAAFSAPYPTGDGRLVIGGSSHGPGDPPDRLYDPRARRWSDLPGDPMGGGSERWYTVTPVGLVATAAPYQPGQKGPALVRAAVFDLENRRWRLLPASDQVGGYRWTWTGTRMVSPILGGVDGGEVDNYGRTYPNGGTLDPAAGTWARLPDAPDGSDGGWPVSALGARWSASSGWIYDDARGSWTRVPTPAGAPGSGRGSDMAGSAVWADGMLVAFGGGSDLALAQERLTNRAWSYRPAAR